ncbi:MAG: metal-dependent hydrolase [Hyphomicrobiaceae bacterium]|nr:metal-dependent hydrolase [Hyphomicrobiaceae bacterium]MCC0008121.1 metal-dependent hydrolase [Hyphomicrobiaceae bacterium]
MANFTTHIGAGTVQAGVLATLTLAADVVAPENLVTVTLAGVLGSVLPDIDLKDSRASKTMFAGLGVFASFVVLFAFAEKFSVIELMILWLGTLVVVRYGLHGLFHRLSVHRGVWHSLIAGVFLSAVTAVTLYYVLGRHEGVAWLGAAFLFLGYVQHLVLDEIYSVDVMNQRIKSSFGTALKIFDARYRAASIAMAVAAVGALALTPPTTTFVEGISQRQLWAGLNQRLLPQGKWFGIIPQIHQASGRSAAAQGPDATSASPITTGTLPPTSQADSK